jgi:hypothetical protein
MCFTGHRSVGIVRLRTKATEFTGHSVSGVGAIFLFTKERKPIRYTSYDVKETFLKEFYLMDYNAL